MPLSSAPQYRPPSVLITATSFESLGGVLRQLTNATFTSGAWPTANLAIYVPFVLSASIPVVKLFAVNGASVSGNVDVGVYDENWGRLFSSGSVAQASTNTLQALATVTQALAPGRYYLGLSCDNTTSTFLRWQPSIAPLLAGEGVAQQASAFPLPSTAVPAVYAQTYLPLFGISQRTIV